MFKNSSHVLLFQIMIVCIAVGMYFLFRKLNTRSPISLEELNKEFRNQYQNALKKWHKEQDYIIVATVNSLILFCKGAKLETHQTTSRMYNDLKSVAHIPITVYLLIKNRDSSSNDALEQYKQQVEHPQLLASIDSNNHEPARRIVQQSQTILSEAINNREPVDQGRLTDFCRSLENDLSTLLEAAAIDQVNLMNKFVQGWRTTYNIDMRNSPPRVVILSPGPACENNLQAIYFEHLFGISHTQEFFYIKDIFSVDRAISIFSGWFYDEQLGDAFFNDPSRMHSDLLVNERVRDHIRQLIS